MIQLGNQPLTVTLLAELVATPSPLQIHPDAQQRVAQSFDFLRSFAKDKVIYGIHTGFGPMAQYPIEASQQTALQYNLIRSHCSGMGAAMPPTHIRAAMLCQLNTLLLGQSGVTPDLPQLLLQWLNNAIYPVVYEHGGVGASGDLVQLAHLALGYIGEGLVWHQGQQRAAAEVLRAHGMAPFSIQLREGLALMNGTAVMTGLGLLHLDAAKNALGWAIIAAALLHELTGAYDDHLSAPLNQAKQHPGQQAIAALLRHLLRDSRRLQKRSQQLYQKNTAPDVFKKKVQEYYSIRCLPQILGPIYDTITHSTAVVEREANSVSDNPIVDLAQQNVYHGGNFHGDYVALAMDHLRLAVAKLSMLAERQLNFLLHQHLNGKLPPFVNLGELGFNFGVQGAQFTATSTTAENQMLSNSMYVHSIPCNNDNQDVVSMGSNAAAMTGRVVENTYQVLAIEFLTIVQAVEYLNIEQQLSSKLLPYYQSIKQQLPPFVEDRPLSHRLLQIKTYLQLQSADNWEGLHS